MMGHSLQFCASAQPILLESSAWDCAKGTETHVLATFFRQQVLCVRYAQYNSDAKRIAHMNTSATRRTGESMRLDFMLSDRAWRRPRGALSRSPGHAGSMNSG